MDNLSDFLLSLEEQLVTTIVRTDAEALTLLLAEDFTEFGSSGRTYNRQQIVEELAIEAPRRVTVHDFVCRALCSEAALVTYRSRSERGETLRSSVWVYRAGRWQMLFHQGTTVASSPDVDAVS